MTVCIHTALQQRTSIDADRDIIMDDERSMTAAELSDRIEVVASHLVARQAPDRVVGIHMANTIDAVIAYFACLQAGAVVATLPRGAPAVVSQIIADGCLSMILTDQEDASFLPTSVPVIHIDTLKHLAQASYKPTNDPLQPAHLLFTSGTSTGKPRAVITDHVGSMRSHAWRTALWPYRSQEVVGCNIFGMWDVVPALHAGIPVVLLSDLTIRDPIRLGDAVTRYGITRMMLTPTLLDACLQCPEAIVALSRLRLVVLCGESISPSLQTRLAECFPTVRIVNLYSLSECHDVAAGDLPSPGEAMRLTLAPFAKVYISAEEKRTQLVPAGTTGRILVGGPGVAQQAPSEQANSKNFFKLTTEDLAPVDVFDTGDRGVVTANGTLEVLGRCESTVKIRGMWVAPADVEAILQQHTKVAQACVTASTNALGHLSLQAHVVPHGGDTEFAVDTLYTWLRERLHSAAVPSQIVLRQSLSLLASGKVDRRQLTQDLAEPREQVSFGSKRSLTEVIRDAYRKVLGQANLSNDASFNHVGGDSLAAVALCAEIERQTGRRMSSSDMKATDTPATLAVRIAAREPEELSATPPSAPRLALLPTTLTKSTQSGQTVLVTGATGGLGQHLVQLLSETSGMQVLALVRSSRHRFPAGVRPVNGDLSQPRFGWSDATYDAVAGEIDHIIHVGADTNMLAPYEDLKDANVLGTERIIQLAARAGASLVMGVEQCRFSTAIRQLLARVFLRIQPVGRAQSGTHRFWSRRLFADEA